MKFLKKIIYFPIFSLFLFFPDMGWGGSLLVPDCAFGSGDCTPCDMIQVLVNWANFFAGGVSTFAMLFFVVGGMYWIFSGGSEERIKKGRSMMVNSIIGIMIVFFSWVVINLVIQVMTGTALGKTGKVFGKDWWRVECVQRVVTDECVAGVIAGTTCKVGSFTKNMSCQYTDPELSNGTCSDEAPCSCVSLCEYLAQHSDHYIAFEGYACLDKNSIDYNTYQTYDEACPENYICAKLTTSP